MSMLKKKDKSAGKGVDSQSDTGATVGSPERATSFKGYNLELLPIEARPYVGGNYKGLHSYTVPVRGAVPQHNLSTVLSNVAYRDQCSIIS